VTWLDGAATACRKALGEAGELPSLVDQALCLPDLRARAALLQRQLDRIDRKEVAALQRELDAVKAESRGLDERRIALNTELGELAGEVRRLAGERADVERDPPLVEAPALGLHSVKLPLERWEEHT